MRNLLLFGRRTDPVCAVFVLALCTILLPMTAPGDTFEAILKVQNDAYLDPTLPTLTYGFRTGYTDQYDSVASNPALPVDETPGGPPPPPGGGDPPVQTPVNYAAFQLRDLAAARDLLVVTDWRAPAAAKQWELVVMKDRTDASLILSWNPTDANPDYDYPVPIPPAAALLLTGPGIATPKNLAAAGSLTVATVGDYGVTDGAGSLGPFIITYREVAHVVGKCLDAGAATVPGAKFRITNNSAGGNTTPFDSGWLDSGALVKGSLAFSNTTTYSVNFEIGASYTIEFSDVTGWVTPASRTFTGGRNTTTTPTETGTYAPIASSLATHQVVGAGYYVVAQTARVSCSFTFPGDKPLTSLQWSFSLPAGWALDSIEGPAATLVGNRADFAFDGGSPAANPLEFVAVLALPVSESGTKTVSSTVTASSGATDISDSPDADLTLEPVTYHTADYKDGGNGVLDNDEISRVLIYWRAGAYQPNATQPDGYFPGAGSQTGPTHAGDYKDGGNWAIDNDEISRMLIYWRAGAYHADPAQPDGFFPGPDPGAR